MSKHVSVVIDSATGLVGCELELPEQANIEAALQAAREQLGDAGIDWQAPCGIFGQLCERAHVPVQGDRIELYRALQVDPRTQRRQRAQRRPRR